MGREITEPVDLSGVARECKREHGMGEGEGKCSGEDVEEEGLRGAGSTTYGSEGERASEKAGEFWPSFAPHLLPSF